MRRNSKGSMTLKVIMKIANREKKKQIHRKRQVRTELKMKKNLNKISNNFFKIPKIKPSVLKIIIWLLLIQSWPKKPNKSFSISKSKIKCLSLKRTPMKCSTLKFQNAKRFPNLKSNQIMSLTVTCLNSKIKTPSIKKRKNKASTQT